MKWYRWVHQLVFAASLVPLLTGVWDLRVRILLPLVALIPYGINESVLDRREKVTLERARELDHEDSLAHAYREPPLRG
ncbi:hypothetical protein [Arthrobacter sp. M4]|uniref:hypothetical protein n=1 Tax=Arthrobacter sp. M4 TaxID=218160 RepID=UPI001CDC5AD2|nr:hypothetical protein [Arthrobacter sp. M4]MCA4133083.1 hypothetical protein [Arthrobacter sp. M4]